MPTLRQPIKEQSFTAISPCLDSGLRRNDEESRNTQNKQSIRVGTHALPTIFIKVIDSCSRMVCGVPICRAE